MSATSTRFKNRWLPVILTLAGLLLPACLLQAQSIITNTRIELKENRIHVKFDIENSKRTDLYNITLEVTDSAGQLLSAASVSGDVGLEIPGGNRKEIIWDLESDGIQMDAEIYFQVLAEAIVEPEPVVEEPVVQEHVTKEPVVEKTVTEETDDEVSETESQAKKGDEELATRDFNRMGLILQSAALPGLGLTRVTGKPHWLRGVAGYGCIATSVIFNRKAISSYDEYQLADSGDLAGSFLQESTSQDNISEICAYAAIGIWAADVIWTIAGTSNMSKPLSIGSGYDPLSGVPLLALRYKF